MINEMFKLPKSLMEELSKGFIWGLCIGIFGWVFSSPILGEIIGYPAGAFIGMFLASLMVAYYYHNITNKSSKLTIYIIIFSFLLVYSGGLTEGVYKHYIPNWAISWIIVYGIITMLVGGLAWQQKHQK